MEVFRFESPAVALHCALFCERLKRTGGTWNLAEANELELVWLRRALPLIVKVLKDDFGICLECEHCSLSTGDELNRVEIALNDFFSSHGNIDYGVLVESTARGICKLLARRCGVLSEQSKIDLVNFTIAPVVPFGIPEFEVSFAAQNNHIKGKCEHTIVYPDLHTLGREHFEILEREVGLTGILGQPHLYHLTRCLLVPSHEVLHFVQSELGQVDKSASGWPSEHDASWASLSLLTALDREGNDPMLGSGLVDACLVYSLHLAGSRMMRWSGEMDSAYKAWQKACGVSGSLPIDVTDSGGKSVTLTTFAPGGEPLDETAFNEHFRAWKEALALEGLVRSDEGVAAQLDIIFRCGGRASGGDINIMPHPVSAALDEGLEVPSEVLPTSQVGAISRLAMPVGTDVALRFISEVWPQVAQA